jgi:hypothetical protein
MGAAELLAGEKPAKTMLGAMPWLMRGMALIPLIQLAGVATTLRRVRQWHKHPESRPSGPRLWGRHILLPLLPNLLVVSSLIPLHSKMRGWISLFMPDFALLARVCGGFAAIWAFIRTSMMLKTPKKLRH